MSLTQRPRRNRRTESIRRLVRETELSPSNFVLPLFVCEGSSKKEAITSMPDCYRYSLDNLVKVSKEVFSLGVPAVALFPVIEESKKDKRANESLNPGGLLQNSVKALKEATPELTVITDVAMDPYSTDGHDGLVENGEILNDETLSILSEMALAQARAGADIVAPSDMMDGRVRAIRSALDGEGFSDVGILSYSAKYASAFYGPFRAALDSAPKSGDKKTYQMDSANTREAVREVLLDIEEGADMVMVKPALAYLDVIASVSQVSTVPVAAYNVSGEYSLLKNAAASGLIDEKAAMLEMLTSIKRSGADVILSYFALEAAKEIN